GSLIYAGSIGNSPSFSSGSGHQTGTPRSVSGVFATICSNITADDTLECSAIRSSRSLAERSMTYPIETGSTIEPRGRRRTAMLETIALFLGLTQRHATKFDAACDVAEAECGSW